MENIRQRSGKALLALWDDACNVSGGSSFLRRHTKSIRTMQSAVLRNRQGYGQ